MEITMNGMDGWYYRCEVCGWVFESKQAVDEREEAYQGRLYEPPTIYCPECGSDEVEEGQWQT